MYIYTDIAQTEITLGIVLSLLWLVVLGLNNSRLLLFIVDMMPRDCKSNHVREIDGAVIKSSSMIYAADPCFLKFKSDDSMVTSKMLMIKFEKFAISDCNVILEIFHGTTAVGQPNVSSDKKEGFKYGLNPS